MPIELLKSLNENLISVNESNLTPFFSSQTHTVHQLWHKTKDSIVAIMLLGEPVFWHGCVCIIHIYHFIHVKIFRCFNHFSITSACLPQVYITQTCLLSVVSEIADPT